MVESTLYNTKRNEVKEFMESHKRI